MSFFETVRQGATGLITDPWYTLLSDGTSAFGTEINPITTAFQRSSYDAFGRISVSSAQTLFSSKLIQNNDPTSWDDTGTGGGTTSTYNTNQSSVTLGVADLTLSSRTRQTFRWIGYQPGKAQGIKLTGILGDPLVTGITRRLGSYNDDNGFFFESNPTDVRLVIRTYTSGVSSDANFALQKNWNIDTMGAVGGTGTNPSGITADWSKVQIFGIEYQWLGVGSVWFYLVINGSKYYVHRFDCSNIETLVYTTTPNLPLRYQIFNDGTGAASSITQVCTAVESDGGVDFSGQNIVADRGILTLTTLAGANKYPLILCRLKAGYFGRQIQPASVDLLCITDTIRFRWAITVNPTIVGTPIGAWVSLSPSSGIEYWLPTNATTITGGREISSGYGASAFRATGSVDSSAGSYWLGSTIAGVSDIVALSVQVIPSGAAQFIGGIEFRES